MALWLAFEVRQNEVKVSREKVCEDQKNMAGGLILQGSRHAPSSPYITWFLRVRFSVLSIWNEWTMMKGYEEYWNLLGGYDMKGSIGWEDKRDNSGCEATVFELFDTLVQHRHHAHHIQ